MAKVKKLKSKLKLKKAGEDTNLDMPKRIPREASEPLESLQDYTTLLYGLKKIGKTSMCQYFKDAFFLMAEPGAKALRVRQTVDAEGRRKHATSWLEVREWIKMLEKDESIRTVILDPIDKIFKLCSAYVCKKNCISHPSEGEWGKGWQDVRDEFEDWILGRLMATGKGIIFISHAKEAEIKTRVGDTYHKITSTMANQAKEAIEGVIDIWCHYRYEGSERVLTIHGDDHVDAGHRLSERFRYTDGSRVRDIPMGKSEKEAFENFMAAFNNELEREEARPRKKLSIKRKK